MTRSSTSSSERPRLAAGFVAIALLLGFDALIGSDAVRAQLEAQVEQGRRAGFVLRVDRRLSQLGATAEDEPQIVVLGNSRAMAALDPEGLENVDVTFVARPGMEPFHQRSLADGVVRGAPDAVILTWSAFDTHRPVRLEPVVGRAVASAPALWDLIGETDAAFLWQNRDSLRRAVLASVSNAYRYRDVLGEAFGFRWRRFATSPALTSPAPPPIAGRARIAFGEADGPRVLPGVRRDIRKLFPLAGDFVAVDQTDMVSEIERGRHVEVQTALLRSAVETIRRAGIPVIVVETPLHPVSRRLYDVALEEDFAVFARDLAVDPGVRFVPRSEMPAFRDADFIDLMHVSESGRQKLTRAVEPALREMAGFVGD